MLLQGTIQPIHYFWWDLLTLSNIKTIPGQHLFKIKILELELRRFIPGAQDDMLCMSF